MNLFNRMGRLARRRNPKRTLILNFERCEDRILLAPIMVTTTTDATTGMTLRDAIGTANTTPGSEIEFNVPTTDSGYNASTHTFTFNLTTAMPLPTIGAQVTIDGTTESTFLGGQPAFIAINGSAVTGTASGLDLGTGSDHSLIKGLEILQFSGAGILINSTDNTIGGTTAGAGNVLGSNGGAGVSISGASNNGNLIWGNDLGTDSAGDNLHNAEGLSVNSASNTIGGTTTAAANVFGFNTSAGVSISGSTNLVEGNFIGTNAGGADLNDIVGVAVTGASNTIGGSTSSAANVIGFNGTAGVSISGATNLVAANFIGTSPTNPTSPQGNAVGVLIDNAATNTIGGTSSGYANIIGFNTAAGTTGAGVSISGASSTGDLIAGNFIGTNAAGILMPNDAGVIFNGSSSNTVGGSVSGAGNAIGFNTSAAVSLSGAAATANAILRNLIFTNGSGIVLNSGNGNQASPVIVGATSVATGANTAEATITVDLTGTGFSASSTYSLDFFASAPGDPSGGVQAHIYLGTTPNPLAGGAKYTLTFSSLTTPLSTSQTVTATATLIATSTLTNTSAFSTAVQVSNPFVVNTTNATGFGSLEQAILNANLDTTNSSPDNITFAITTGSAPYVIGLPTAGLTAIAHPVVLDATTQPGYSGSPIIVLNGGSGAITGSGLVLSTDSDGSTIKGLDIIDFTTANTEAIDVESGTNVLLANDIGVETNGTTSAPNLEGILINGSNNTIGSTASGGANVIAGNTGDGVNLNTGIGNAIRQNSIFDNGTGIAGSGNGGQTPPTLQTVTITATQTAIGGELTNIAAGTYTVEFFSSGTSTPGPDQAQVFLGNKLVTSTGSTATFNATLPLTLPSGQTVVATVTPTNNNTSAFSNDLTVYTGFVVTTASDNATTPVAGSLRQVINNVNANPPANGTTDTITFSISTGPQTITLAAALPSIMVPVTIDGSTQPGYAGTPIIEIDGNTLAGDGLTLASGSSGSTINALEIVSFASGNGINVQSNNDVIKGDYIGTTFNGTNFVAGPGNQTGILINGSNNTIGGTASGSGNVIAFNPTQAVDVASGTGNAIRQNLIFQSGSTPILVAAGTAAPTGLAFTSVPGLTTIQGQISGTVGNTETLDFFASDTSGDSPAFQFLGTMAVTLSTSPQSFTETFNLANALTSSQTVTATATGPNNSTSEFATSASFTDPYKVITGTDGVIGSLRQAIIDANAAPGTPIRFTNLPTPYAINLTSALPAITVPVTIDGTSLTGYDPATGVIVSINGTGAGTANGLTLAAGSGGSVIEGLEIVDFSEAGIIIQSASNTIGGTATGAGNVIGSNATGVQITNPSAATNLLAGNFIGTDSANDNLGNASGIQIFNSSNNTIGGTVAGSSNTIGFNTSNGIAVFSGSGNTIRENIYTGSNGTLVPTEANDIGLGPNANNNQPAPALISAALDGSQISVLFTQSVTTANTNVILDFYKVDTTSNPVERQFLGAFAQTVANSTTQYTATFTPLFSVGIGDTIIATTTVPSTGNTSAFSGRVSIITALTVTNTNNTGPGSLFAAITSANGSPGSTIAFNIPTSDPGYNSTTHTFTISLTTSLPNITAAVTIDGTTESTFLNGQTAFIEIKDNGITGTAYGLNLASNVGGSDIFGLEIVGFNGAGILIQTANNVIGGTTAGDGNVLGSNSGAGVSISGVSATANTVAGNYIGTDSAGDDLANGFGVIDSSGSNTIGGTTSSAANVFGFNSSAGLSISGSNELVEGNFIGTSAGGADLNDIVGVAVSGSSNTIGGSTTAAANVFGFNGTAGVSITGSTNLVAADFIGTSPTNPTSPQGNAVGVAIASGSANTIGGTLSGYANIIGFNTAAGVSISGSATGERIEGNYIGTNAAGILTANADGVLISGSASNTIGGTVVGAGNTIGFNTAAGVSISGSTAIGNAILENLIFTNTSGGIVLNNNGANHNQASPVITGVTSVATGPTTTTTTITVDLTGSGFSAGSTYSLDFFASALGDPGGLDEAHIYLGTQTPLAGGAKYTVTFSSLTTPLSTSQTVTATATLLSGSTPTDTSAFAAAVAVANPFTVTTTEETGFGSLAQAITNANDDTSNNTDTITFAIPPTSPAGPLFIMLSSALPLITHPVVLDATTQAGFSGSPIVVLEGTVNSGSGLVLSTGSGGSTIKGFDIIDFTGANADGIDIESNGNIVQTNYIGVETDGATAAPNTQGILINGSNNTIGSTAAGGANVIASNTGDAVNVQAGNNGNAIRQNSIFANGSGIVLTGNANDNQAPPSLTGATSEVGTTTIQGSLAGFAASTAYIVEFFASVSTDPQNVQGQAHVFLGSTSITTDSSGNAPINVTLSVSVPFGQAVTATATSSTTNDTSAFATAVTVANPFVVTTTQDNGDNTNPTLGSLRQVINSINSAAPGTTTITFDIASGTAPFVISLANHTALPALTHPVTIDGTSQPGYAGTPIIEIDGGGLTGDGLTLGTNSDGSTIKGLEIVDFVGSGIHIESSDDLVIGDDIGTALSGSTFVAGPGNQVGVLIDGTAPNASGNTIGGTSATSVNIIGFNSIAGVSISGTSAIGNLVVGNLIGTDSANDSLGNGLGVSIAAGASNNSIGGTGAGNTIAFNNGDGVQVSGTTTSGYLISQNLIYGNTGQGIDLIPSIVQPAPTKLAYSSIPNLTTIQGQLTGNVGDVDTLEFFASSSGGLVPAFQLLGTTTVTLSATSQSFTATFNLANALTITQTVTATSTLTSTTTLPAPVYLNSTSEFATSAAFSDPFMVVTGNDSGIGSLRQAIIDANANPGNTIKFDLPSAPYEIDLASSLPAISAQVTIDGTTQPGYVSGNPPLVELNANGVGGDGLTLIAGSKGSTIEGLNIVGFLSGAGIRVESDGNLIREDYVGTASSSNALGVYVSGNNNTVGGTTAAASNVISNIIGAGVTIDTGTGDLITHNSIFANGQGISLQDGGNLLQPAPTLTSASTTGSSISIAGQLNLLTNSLPIQTYTIEFFTNPVGTLSPEGQVFLGTASVNTDGSGNLSLPFSTTFSSSVPLSSIITATVTSPLDNTSMFSTGVVAVSPFTVTTTADNVMNPPVGSLRAAIIAANDPANAVITFNIPTTDSGYDSTTGTWTIKLAAALPAIAEPVTIDGTTQPGYYALAAINPSNPAPVILIDGGGLTGDGLTLGAGSQGSEILGLRLFDFAANTDPTADVPGAGIHIESNGDTLADDWLGLPPANSIKGNAIGLVIDNASNNVIGLPTLSISPQQGSSLSPISISGLNVISGNTGAGVSINGGTKNLIQDTFVGTDSTGASKIANGGDGIVIDSSSQNMVGGTASGTLNNGTVIGGLVLVSGNGGDGILVSGDPSGGHGENLIQNTYIGTDINGAISLANLKNGIEIDNSSENSVGGTVGGTINSLLNLISGNKSIGILISGNPTVGGTVTASNVIQNSFIGTDINGQNAIGNAVGIQINGSSDNTVGSTVLSGGSLFSNLISGNKGDGVQVMGSTSSANVIIDSYIGPDISGSNSKYVLHNADDGIDIVDAVDTQVGFGGTDQAPIAGGNLISANGTLSGTVGYGVAIAGTSMGTVLLYNKIGTDPSGGFISDQLHNLNYGVLIDTSLSSGVTIGATIGGTLAGSGNVISGNAKGGIDVAGSGYNLILGNSIGTNSQGNAALANAGDGITVSDSSNNTIGGVDTGASNLISGNSGDGITITGSDSTDDDIYGNKIGTDLTGTLSLGNVLSGIVISGGASSISVGSALGTGGNLIASNRVNGLEIDGGSNNSVVANTIGAASGNLENGISLQGSFGNTIGGPVIRGANNTIAGLGSGANFISNNGIDGILVMSMTAVSEANLVEGNLVSSNTKNGIHVVNDLTSDTLQVRIVDNFVGTNPAGTSTYVNGAPQGNGLNGILLEESATSISGTTSSNLAALVSGNISSDNGLSGIAIQPYSEQTNPSPVSLAKVSIIGNRVGTNSSGSYTTDPTNATLPLGNALDGILLNDVYGVTIGASGAGAINLNLIEGNLISGNLGAGIDVRDGGDVGNNFISDNVIGVVILTQNGSPVVSGQDGNGQNAGNLADGIFLLDAPLDTIQGNLISNNRGYGIRSAIGVNSNLTAALSIIDNFIGTDDQGGATVNNLGNGADGIFLDTVPNTNSGVSSYSGTVISENVISHNRANGIDLLDSSSVSISGNEIGTDSTGSQPGLGNAADGIFVNQSNNITIGGTSAAVGGGSISSVGNVISGNSASGIFISGASGTKLASGNLVEGNYIGTDSSGSVAISNAVVGIVLSNAGPSDSGPGNTISSNVISGNLLYGVLLSNTAVDNQIVDNMIGTDASGTVGLGNTADGVFLLGGSTSAQNNSSATDSSSGNTLTGTLISENTISGNVVSGNNSNGIQVFGQGAIGNTVTNNLIGLAANGMSSIPNLGNGVFLNNAGSGNIIGGNAASDRNFISGNEQSGVMILGDNSIGFGNTIQGNFIGTDESGNAAVGNGSDGVFIFGGSSAMGAGNTIANNLISGNSESGIVIFTPSYSAEANSNQVVGNEIGTRLDGEYQLPNHGDGIDIINSQFNTVGPGNIISGNLASGVVIESLTGSQSSSVSESVQAMDNVVTGNLIGTDGMGQNPIANMQNGVLVVDSTDNTIGDAGSNGVFAANVPAKPSNVISGNDVAGIQFAGESPSNLVQGNYIGLSQTGGALALSTEQYYGVFINNLGANPSSETIGGTVVGTGNLISGNGGVGIEITGPQNTVGGLNSVLGNVIGLDKNDNLAGDSVGIYILNSASNTIGGASAPVYPGTSVPMTPINVISGNANDGILISGLDSTQNVVGGNFIGTGLGGGGYPIGSSESGPAQFNGVVINNDSSYNTIGGDAVGGNAGGNVISGNDVGVQVVGLKTANGNTQGGQESILDNLIGTDATGTKAVSNLEFGILINNSSFNTIGAGNVISANGVAGIELLNAGATRNSVVHNLIGTDVNSKLAFQSKSSKPVPTSDGILVYPGAQLNGVVVLGASNNTIGATTSTPNLGNYIAGNIQVGVYVTSRDYHFNVFPQPVANWISGNIFNHNPIYAILFYDATSNLAPPFDGRGGGLIKNSFSNTHTPFRNYLNSFDIKTKLAVGKAKISLPSRQKITQASKPHPKNEKAIVEKAVRPRVPALFEEGSRHVAVRVNKANPGKHAH